MTAQIEFNATAATDENAPVGEKLIAALAPLYNSLVEREAQYLAVTNVEEAVKAWEPQTEEDQKLAKQIEQATALIEKNRAILEEKARAAVISEVAPDFDEAKFVASFKEDRATLVEWTNSTRQTFDLIGFLKSEVSEKGRRGNWQGVTPDGEKLVQIMANMPKLDSKSSGSSDADTPEKVQAREDRKNAKTWARKNGETVADKGQISKDLMDRWVAAGKPVVTEQPNH